MMAPEIYPILSEIFAEVFFRDDIELRPELTAADVEGWNSHKQIEIILAAEERFGATFNSKEINGLGCVGDLAALIEKKTS